MYIYVRTKPEKVQELLRSFEKSLQARTLCGDDKNAMVTLKIQNNNDILITWFKTIVVLGTFC